MGQVPQSTSSAEEAAGAHYAAKASGPDDHRHAENREDVMVILQCFTDGYSGSEKPPDLIECHINVCVTEPLLDPQICFRHSCAISCTKHPSPSGTMDSFSYHGNHTLSLVTLLYPLSMPRFFKELRKASVCDL